MKSIRGIDLSDVQAVYSGPEGRLWELLMGEQIHIGGMTSSADLAERAGIRPGMAGVDLCCCTGAGMRYLVRFRRAGKMTGVDATPRSVELGRQRVREEGLADRIEFVQAEATASGLPDGCADFVWGEDAWCYVADKPRLIAEAVRLVKPGGIIAFTDWLEGPTPLTTSEAERLLRFMKFPDIQDLSGYRDLLIRCGCRIVAAENTGRFAAHVDLYTNMAGMQLTYDALKIIAFDQEQMAGLVGGMHFMQQLAHREKLIQGLIVAQKK